MTKAEAQSLKAFTAMVLMQLTLLAMRASLSGENVSAEGRKIGEQLAEYIDSMVDSDE